jgi:hypothetical protein
LNTPPPITGAEGESTTIFRADDAGLVLPDIESVAVRL